VLEEETEKGMRMEKVGKRESTNRLIRTERDWLWPAVAGCHVREKNLIAASKKELFGGKTRQGSLGGRRNG